MQNLPMGTVTLLFTDIEGSTRLLTRLGERYSEVLARCRHLLRSVFADFDGYEVETQGDAFFVVFARAADAVAAAVAAQRALATHAWPEGIAVHVRMGLHTGSPALDAEGYVGVDVHHAARIMSAGHGGQVLLSEATRALVEHSLPDGVNLRDLGEHDLKDLPRKSHLFQVVLSDLPADFPPLRTLTPPHMQVPGPGVLVTKITIPPLRAQLLPREHLLGVLDQSRSVPLTLLSAGAGFGKTTLLSAWANQSNSLVAWLTLDEQDNDPTRFWTYVIAALSKAGTTLGEAAEALLRSSQSSLLASVLTSLLNNLAERAQDTALILEDYQVISEPAIHASLQFVLDRLPPNLHLLLSSRSDPPLPLARLRARGQVVEIREPELRLNGDEATGFLKEVMGLALSAEEIARLGQRTEGWVAGLQLAALSLRRHIDVSAFLQTFTGSHRFLLDYVQEEILEPLPEAQHHFLLHTSVLSRMNAELCQRLSGERASQQMLEKLERAHLFLIPLDEERRWYRWHTLFREVLLARLQAREPEQVARLHREAALWYAAQGWLYEGIPHALQARDFGFAVELIERFIVLQDWRNELHTLRLWLARLPKEVLHASTELSFLYGAAVVWTTPRGPQTLSLVEEQLQLLEERYRAEGNQARLGAVLTGRAVLTVRQGELASAFTQARQALSLLPEQERQWRGHCLNMLGIEAVLTGQLAQAKPLLLQSLSLLESVGWLPGIMGSMAMLGEVCLSSGALQQAASYFHRTLDILSEQSELARLQLTLETGTRENYYERLALFGLAQLSYEWNQLEAATDYLHQAQTGVQFIWMHMLTLGLLLQVRLLSARGETKQAQALLGDLSTQARQSEVLQEIQLCQAWLALNRGDLTTGEHWAASYEEEADPLTLRRQEEEILLLARLRIAEGQPEAALALIKPWKQKAQVQERRYSELRFLVQESLAQAASGNRAQAREVLRQALTHAESEGYQRLFLDEGQPIASLLQSLLPELREEALSAYVRTLLHASRSAQMQQQALPAGLTPGLLAPLTPQERRVLLLLAEGASNQEIANQLVVSHATAKKHVASLLSKLGAENRTQAVAQARAFALL